MKLSGVLPVFLSGLCLAVVSGCTTAPRPPVFQRYTTEVFPPKPTNSPMPILYGKPERKFESIARYCCFDTHFKRSELMEVAKIKARREGADAIVVFENQETSKPYSREIRKCDPPTPDIPDKSQSRGGGNKHCRSNRGRTADREGNPDYSFAANANKNAATWYSETVTGTDYSLAFDVEMIVFREPAKRVTIPSSEGADKVEHYRAMLGVPSDAALKRP